MKAISLTNQKIWPMKKFLQTNKWTLRQTDRSTTICSRLIDAGAQKGTNLTLCYKMQSFNVKIEGF